MTGRPTPPPARGGRGRRTAGPPRRPRTSAPPREDPARAAAADLLAAVRERGAYANLALPAILAEHGLAGRDAALATELGYGSCRTAGQLDAVLAACGDRPLADLDGPVLDALRLGAYQLLHTRIPSHAAVSATVDLVRSGPRPHASGYVNAVLRRVAERDLPVWVERLAPAEGTDPLARLALATAHPRWIVTALHDALGSDADSDLAAALDADSRPAAVHLVARPGILDRDALIAETGGEPGRWSPYAVYLPSGSPGAVASVARGAAGVQDEGSQLVAAALADAALDGPDRRWLDLAAGPGGKAALLGALAAQRGATLAAVETAPHRADLVRSATAGLPVTVHTADGRDPGLESGSFDRVLLDAPCTGLGALRRRPEARWRRTEADVGPLVRLQRELLASAARLVRPGGVVGYVTCSPHLAETAGVIARRPESLEPIDARRYLPEMPELGPGPTVQLWPHRHGTDGMFLAVLRRRT
jgi:16S rRNA (cytosine967-C5)-methyltransferase